MVERVYFLTSACLLAGDLARHPSGVAVADVVDRVLALSAHEAAALRDPAPAAVRERVLACCADEPRLATAMGGVTATLADGLPGPRVSRALLDVLTATLTGGLADLHALLEREVALEGDAQQVALDGVTAAWSGRRADLTDLVRLRAPWLAAIDPVPPALPEGPWSAGLSVLLDDLHRRTPEQWRAVVAAHQAVRGLGWSAAVHEACRVAFEADRLVVVARAQLAAARALRLSGASTGHDAHAVAMAVTGAVQALCTADLHDGAALTRAWSAGS